MLYTIAGSVITTTDQAVVVSCGAMSFACFTPRSSSYQAGTSVTFYTFLQWHPEQGPSLYGFASEVERNLFELVTSCNGIGPKIGLALLEQFTPSDFVHAVQSGDQKALARVSGIGAKKAEQLLVQMRHKVEKLVASGVVLPRDERSQAWNQISQVLESLSYSRQEVHAAMDHLRGLNQPEIGFDQLVRSALSYLAKSK